MDRATSFGDALKQRRKALDLTQHQLAERVPCARITIQRIEQGKLRPSRELAQRLTDILQVPLDERPHFANLARSISTEPPAPQPVAPTDTELGRSQLPAPVTPLIGRVREVAVVTATLATGGVRLLTLIGPGGVGKTRLALQVAAELEATFRDGVVFVDLAPIRDPNQVVAGIAATLDLKEAAGEPISATLQRHIRDKLLLLVLDNVEHLLSATPVVAELLQAAPQLSVLLTSRVVTGVYGEHTFLVPPLMLPDLDNLPPCAQLLQTEAVELFVRRAEAADLDFRLTNANARAVSEICHYLDGLPLALELAAARLRLLPPELLLHHLTEHARGRLQLLTNGPRTAPPRQQALRTMLDWSYSLLDPLEQRLFRRLAVFVGGFTPEAVEQVCASDGVALNTLDGLQSLLDKSLMQRRPSTETTPRFTLLETVREYALEQLDASSERELLCWRHARYYCALAKTAKPALFGPQQVAWFQCLKQEHPNLRTALAWCFQPDGTLHRVIEPDQRAELGLALAVAIGPFWGRRGYLSEGRDWLTQALSQAAAGGATEGRTAAYRQQRAGALALLGMLAAWQEDRDTAQSAYEASLELYHALGDTVGTAEVLGYLGLLYDMRNDPVQAEALVRRSLALYRALDDAHGIAYSLFFLGMLAYATGDARGAGELWDESLPLFRAGGDVRNIAMNLIHRGMAMLDQGDEERAGAQVWEGLRMLWELGDRWQTALALEIAAGVAAFVPPHPNGAGPDRLLAARLLGAAERLRETLSAPVLPYFRAFYQRCVHAAQSDSDEVAFAAAWAAGRALSLEQAIAEALEVTSPIQVQSHQVAPKP